MRSHEQFAYTGLKPFSTSQEAGITTSPLLEEPSSATPPTTDVGEDAGKKEPSYTVGGNVD
jgi:hypothetical protein